MSPLLADDGQIGRFAERMFRHAREGGVVSLRAFYDDGRPGPGRDKAFRIRPVLLDGRSLQPVVQAAARMAAEAASSPRPVVVCAPIATFRGRRASEAEVREGLALSVECDARPQQSLQILKALAGPPTIVVASGGLWPDPGTGGAQERLHIHYRLAEPTRSPAEHSALRRLRAATSMLVGADASNIPAVHPIRWPGTWHRKDPARPRIARIVEEDPESEIALEHALPEFEGLVALLGCARGPGARIARSRPTEPELLGACAARIANPDLPWDGWNRLGMATFRASGGDEAGYAAFDAVSRKSGKYDPDATRARWDHYRTSPPTRIGLGTLIHEARRADPAFLRPDPSAATRSDRTNGRGFDARVVVRLSDDRWNEVAAECAGFLLDTVYLRGTVPVVQARVREADRGNAGDRNAASTDLWDPADQPGALVLVEASPPLVAFHLDRLARFTRARGGVATPSRCPLELAARIAAAAVALGFRPIAGVVRVPLLLGNRLIVEPGYHPPSGLILDLSRSGPEFPAAPDRTAAEAAAERILGPFRGYLRSGVSRSALLAAALTAVLRPSLRTCPAVHIDGNTSGVGKGKLARALAALATGGPPAVITEGHGPEETEKRIAAAVVQGAPAIVLDNLQRHVSSSTLESVLTEAVADIRAFGKLASLRVTCRALFVLTANNATIRRDMLRRLLPVRIVVAEERPELRRFGFDPVEEVLASRERLLAAAFTIVLAWLRVRDLPENQVLRRPLGSFEEWADLVAAAVAWLTGENPVDLIHERGCQDPLAADERLVIEALTRRYGQTAWTAKQAAADLDPELWAAVIDVRDGRVDPAAVGRWLRSRKDRVFGGVSLTNRSGRDGVARWHLRGMGGIAGDSGLLQRSPTPRPSTAEDGEDA